MPSERSVRRSSSVSAKINKRWSIGLSADVVYIVDWIYIYMHIRCLSTELTTGLLPATGLHPS